MPKDQYLLNRVKITVDDKRIKPSDIKPYLRQTPNHKTFGIIGLPLAFYNMSGTKDNRWNKFMRKIGSPPIIYDSLLTEKSVREITKAMHNKGYMEAVITTDTIIKKRKLRLTYKVKSGIPYQLGDIKYNIPDDSIANAVLGDTAAYLLKSGRLFDNALLDQERQRISERLKNRGYYAFNKEYITFTADTTIGNHLVDIELNILPYPIADTTGNGISMVEHRTYTIRNVSFITDYNPMNIDQRYNVNDTVIYKGYNIYYGTKHYLKPSALVGNCFIRPGTLYRTRNVDNTLAAFGRLRVLKYVNIQFVPVQSDSSEMLLDCYIMLTLGKTQSISTELEGTNSAGDFGFAVGVTYQHRNIFHGSQTFSTKLRAAYENMSGNFSDLVSNNYLELGAEIGISFPKYIFPFAKETYRQRMRPTTDLILSGSFQQRPEYIRVIAGAGWGYKWYSHRNMFRHKLDLID
ncbi:MAG: outer membrane protein assembly factor, partial [Bacteroidales bacterium]